MLSIYANAIRVATGMGPDPADTENRKTHMPNKWLPKGHWWLRAERSVDETRRPR